MSETPRPVIRCAIYARKSVDERFAREVGSIGAQREVCSAYIRSQQHKAGANSPRRTNKRAKSGGTLDRPALHQLIADIESGVVDMVVIYKNDRPTRSLRNHSTRASLKR